jgi:creatinine amidohydrolase
MKRSVWLQHLTPREAAARRDRCAALLTPVAPIEWHGPHLPLGTDPLIATAVAELAAHELGATAYPTLYVGTERERTPAMLRSIGLPEDARIEGMDFPANTYRSFYFREEVFALVLRDLVGMARANGYRLVYIVNGHGAENQLGVIQRLCAELDDPPALRVAWGYAFAEELRKTLIAHAAAEETSIMLHLEPKGVRLDELPAVPTPLRNADFAIVDGPTFDGRPTRDYTVRQEVDPRTRSNAQTGRRYLEAAAREIAQHARQLLGGSK